MRRRRGQSGGEIGLDVSPGLPGDAEHQIQIPLDPAGQSEGFETLGDLALGDRAAEGRAQPRRERLDPQRTPGRARLLEAGQERDVDGAGVSLYRELECTARR